MDGLHQESEVKLIRQMALLEIEKLAVPPAASKLKLTGVAESVTAVSSGMISSFFELLHPKNENAINSRYIIYRFFFIF
jgi:hypothetical protein